VWEFPSEKETMSNPTMNCGPHTGEVLGLLLWIERGELLRFGKPLSGLFIAVADFDEAKELAQYEADDQAGWIEIRDQADALMYEVGLLDTPAWLPYKAGISGLLFKVANRVDTALPDDYRDIIDDVIADLHACARCLAVHGRLDPFHERLWQAYACGGWPCGCTGEPLDPDEPSLLIDDRLFYVFWRAD
jgi:hypothetical protein